MKIENLYNNAWISLKKIIAPDRGIKGYVYSHETRCNGAIISILPFRRVQQEDAEPRLLGIKKNIAYGSYAFRYEYLLKLELTPCWSIDKQILSTITGGCEGEQPIYDAIRELREETGYEAERNEFTYLDTSYASKSSDTIYSLFTIDLTGKAQGKIKGDGSRLEAEAKAVWVTEDEILKCKDPQASVSLLRLKKIIGK